MQGIAAATFQEDARFFDESGPSGSHTLEQHGEGYATSNGGRLQEENKDRYKTAENSLGINLQGAAGDSHSTQGSNRERGNASAAVTRHSQETLAEVRDSSFEFAQAAPTTNLQELFSMANARSDNVSRQAFAMFEDPEASMGQTISNAIRHALNDTLQRGCHQFSSIDDELAMALDVMANRVNETDRQLNEVKRRIGQKTAQAQEEQV